MRCGERHAPRSAARAGQPRRVRGAGPRAAAMGRGGRRGRPRAPPIRRRRVARATRSRRVVRMRTDGGVRTATVEEVEVFLRDREELPTKRENEI